MRVEKCLAQVGFERNLIIATMNHKRLSLHFRYEFDSKIS